MQCAGRSETSGVAGAGSRVRRVYPSMLAGDLKSGRAAPDDLASQRFITAARADQLGAQHIGDLCNMRRLTAGKAEGWRDIAHPAGRMEKTCMDCDKAGSVAGGGVLIGRPTPLQLPARSARPRRRRQPGPGRLTRTNVALISRATRSTAGARASVPGRHQVHSGAAPGRVPAFSQFNRQQRQVPNYIQRRPEPHLPAVAWR